MKRYEWLYISILIIIPLLIAVLTFRDYGESVDEGSLYTYSDYSLRAYTGVLNLDFNPNLGKGNFRYYGPAFLMATNLSARLITGIFEGINKTEAWHFMYFLSFLASGVGLFFIAKRWYTNFVAFAITLLFLFQPMLWGHAFINPKDIPFMSFCVLSVLTSLIMQEKLFAGTTSWNLPNPTALKLSWQQTEGKQRKHLMQVSLWLILVLSIYLFGQHWLEKIVVWLLEKIYSSSSENIFTLLFSTLAKNYKTIPAGYYIPKGMKTINFVLLLSAVSLSFKIFLQIWEVFIQTPLMPTRASLSNFVSEIFQYLRNPWVLIAGLVLGLTASIRILGPALGGIALIIALKRAKLSALSAFIAYFMLASITMYISWPYLWASPIARFQAGLTYMSKFPWEGKVLFNGIYYPTDKLPFSYVPVLLGVQFTEPAIFLFILGTCIFIYKIWQKTLKFEFAVTTLFWGILPLIVFTILRPSLYDNTRQLLFITPPLFLIIGLVIEWLFQRLHNPLVNYLVLLLLLYPGIHGMLDLHPYQYTYYNTFANGLQGSYRRFESDYWATSFREAIEYLNQTAPPNSRVIVYGPGDIGFVERFSRPDLIVDSYGDSRYDAVYGYDYAIVSTRFEGDVQHYSDWQTIYAIQRDKNIFAVVRKRP